MASLLPVLGYSVIPVLPATIGAAATVWRKPGGQVTSVVQHFAAGVVLARAGVALLLPLGAAAGMFLFQGLAQAWLTGFFAFGLVALLYLVTEELLVEAHEKADTPVATAVFFVGFFLLILLDEAIR